VDTLELGQLLGGMDQKLDALLEQKSDHEGRIQSLEKLRWYTGGALAAIGAFFITKARAVLGV
jgi:hypothetical protein